VLLASHRPPRAIRILPPAVPGSASRRPPGTGPKLKPILHFMADFAVRFRAFAPITSLVVSLPQMTDLGFWKTAPKCGRIPSLSLAFVAPQGKLLLCRQLVTCLTFEEHP